MSYDLLAERARILKQYGSTWALARRVIELEEEVTKLTQEAAQICPFEKHPDRYGFITHRHYLGELGGVSIIQCEVCGNVTAQRPIPVG